MSNQLFDEIFTIQSLTTLETTNEIVEYLGKNKFNVPLMDFVAYIRQRFNPELDISFMEEFLDFCKKTDFCIHHSMLKTYGVLNNIKTSRVVLDCLNQFSFIEGEDYIMNLIKTPLSTGGFNKKKEYHLKTETLKLCLMRSKNERKYARYYIFLETCIYHYKEYQNMKQATVIEEQKMSLAQKDDRIDQLIKQLMNRQEEGHSQLMDAHADTVGQLNAHHEVTKTHLVSTEKKLTSIQKKLHIVEEISVPDTKDISKGSTFILFELNNPEYDWHLKVIRTQQKYVSGRVNKLQKDFPNMTEVLRFALNPNAVNFFNRVKDAITEGVEYNGQLCTIRLTDMTKEEFTRQVMLVDGQRFEHKERSVKIKKRINKYNAKNTC
jgi:hypothetical protein